MRVYFYCKISNFSNQKFGGSCGTHCTKRLQLCDAIRPTDSRLEQKTLKTWFLKFVLNFNNLKDCINPQECTSSNWRIFFFFKSSKNFKIVKNFPKFSKFKKKIKIFKKITDFPNFQKFQKFPIFLKFPLFPKFSKYEMISKISKISKNIKKKGM